MHALKIVLYLQHMIDLDKIKQNIHSGHRERLRENIAKAGIYNSDEIHFLEYLLTFVITRADTNPIAHNLLDRFGSLDEIFDADIEALLAVDGVGIKTARFLQYMSAVAYNYNKSKAMKRQKLDTPKKVIQFIKGVLPPSDNEQLILLVLNKNFTLKSYKVFKGVSHAFISLDVNDITDYLIKYKAHFCIIAHTHPKHNASPSDEDIRMTNTFVSLFNALSIVLVENYILGEDGYYSLKTQTDYYYDDQIGNHYFVNSKNYNDKPSNN